MGAWTRRQNPGMTTRLVFLVPGFFGFTSVGAVSYFEDVEQTLSRALQRLGLISYARGHIVAMDRHGLEKRACECYAVVKNEYDRLLPDRVTTKPAVRRISSQPAARTGLYVR